MTSPLLTNLLRNRRFQLLLLTSVLAFVLGFRAFTPTQAISLVTVGGYWAMLGVFGWYVWALWHIRPPSERWPKPHTVGWKVPAIILGCGLLLLVHERYGFKILMDEVMLLSTSQGMHFDKQPLASVRGHDLQGAFQLLEGRLDKRPLFQPFLVCALHDLTGYRPENVFVLNTVLTFVFLTLAYFLGRRVAGPPAGIAVVLLLTSLPLLAQNATGGGFELLNLVMIAATFLLGYRYAERRDTPSQRVFLLSAVLLAQTRYESVLFLLPVGVLVLWVWWRERAPILDWTTLFAPLLLVPAALHQKIFTARESSWELGSRPGYEQPFSVSYIGDNVAHALNFFFDTTGDHSNSFVLSVLGFLALPFVLLGTAKILLRPRQASPAQMTQALFVLGFAAHTLLMLCYFWGRFDDPVIRRLSLPLNLWLVVGVVIAFAELFPRWTTSWRWLMGVTVVGTLVYSLPAMARHDYSQDYYVGREMEWRREFMAHHPEKDYLVIDNNSHIWITHLVSATPVKQTLLHKERILFNFKNRTFTAFYVFQRYHIDPADGRQKPEEDDDLGPDFKLETVWERRFTPLTVSRISRVVAIDDGPITTPVKQSTSLEKMTPAEREQVRQAYFENFVRQLP